ncbi:MAG TPA: putative metalloprotease CJM1_0395 family protein [Candidatus Paceibacterota bacterium]|nr:putative metalloprotease CJM1_0395 family protein [Candidatus Paceibacterota bacterium]
MDIRAIGAVNGGTQLTAEEMAQVAKLAARDREVRIHESQHLAAAGAMASGVEYEYERGPDGKMYAVGGKVRMTVSSSRSPEEALDKARQLRAAASAPSDPSGQDMSVMAKASQMEAEALQKLNRKNTEQAGNSHGSQQHNLNRGFNRLA